VAKAKHGWKNCTERLYSSTALKALENRSGEYIQLPDDEPPYHIVTLAMQ